MTEPTRPVHDVLDMQVPMGLVVAACVPAVLVTAAAGATVVLAIGGVR